MVTQAARRPGNRDAAELVRALNENWPEDLPYFTMIYGELETATGRGVLVQAGHPSPLLVEKTGRITALGEGGVPVGIDESSSYATIPFSLDSGDRLLLYSDGVVEAENDLDEAYSDARLQALVTQNAHVTSRDFLEILELDVRSWCGPTGVEDDISALVLERTF
jgi:serine phosphatase RsbU (regulator of sigma subunit)